METTSSHSKHESGQVTTSQKREKWLSRRLGVARNRSNTSPSFYVQSTASEKFLNFSIFWQYNYWNIEKATSWMIKFEINKYHGGNIDNYIEEMVYLISDNFWFGRCIYSILKTIILFSLLFYQLINYF